MSHIQAVHDAEDHLERTKLKADDARNNLQQVILQSYQNCVCLYNSYCIQARLSLRMKRREFSDGNQIYSHVACSLYHNLLCQLGTVLEDSDFEEEKADVVVPFKELDDVLMKDVGDKIASSGK